MEWVCGVWLIAWVCWGDFIAFEVEGDLYQEPGAGILYRHRRCHFRLRMAGEIRSDFCSVIIVPQ